MEGKNVFFALESAFYLSFFILKIPRPPYPEILSHTGRPRF
jgi:hypothetical protein